MPDQGERTVLEWGIQIDCAANGCAKVHADDGQVHPHNAKAYGVPKASKPPKINNHAARWVQRTVSYSSWKPAFGPEAES